MSLAGIDSSEMDVEVQHLAFELYAKTHAPAILGESAVMPVHHIEDILEVPHKSYWASMEEVEDIDSPSKLQKPKASTMVLAGRIVSDGMRASS